MNCRTKFDAASFIIGGEIRNRTKTNKHTQTVNDISTPCLSACVDNELEKLLRRKITFRCLRQCFCQVSTRDAVDVMSRMSGGIALTGTTSVHGELKLTL